MVGLSDSCDPESESLVAVRTILLQVGNVFWLLHKVVY
jgi:hypothetical protein